MNVEFSWAFFRIDHCLALLPEHRIEREPQSPIQRHCNHHNGRELRAIGKDHDQGRGCHETVDQSRHQALGQQVVDGLDGSKSGQHIADMTLLEIGERQPDQMMEEAGADLKMQSILQDQDDE